MTDDTRTQPSRPPEVASTTLDRLFGTLSRAPRRRILTALDHDHLPRLDDVGFVEWNRETETVRRGPRYDEIAPLLELLDAARDELSAD